MAGDKNDKTQMLSESQVVEVKPQPPPKPSHAAGHRPSAEKNDRSMWLGKVVGVDEFAPTPPPKSKAPRYIVAGVIAAGAIGGGAYYLWPSSTNPVKAIDAARSPDAAPPPDATVRTDAAPRVDAAAPVDAAEPADAGTDAGTPDAGVPAKKPPPKKPPPKKPPPKKPPPKKPPVKKPH